MNYKEFQAEVVARGIRGEEELLPAALDLAGRALDLISLMDEFIREGVINREVWVEWLGKLFKAVAETAAVSGTELEDGWPVLCKMPPRSVDHTHDFFNRKARTLGIQVAGILETVADAQFLRKDLDRERIKGCLSALIQVTARLCDWLGYAPQKVAYRSLEVDDG